MVRLLAVVTDDVGMLGGTVCVTTGSAARASSLHKLLPLRIDVLLRSQTFDPCDHVRAPYFNHTGTDSDCVVLRVDESTG